LLQRVFQLDTNADLTQHPLEFSAHSPANITGRGLDCLEDRQAGPDCADDEIEGVRERVEEPALVSTLCELHQKAGSIQRGCARQSYREARRSSHYCASHATDYCRREGSSCNEVGQPDPPPSRCKGDIEPRQQHCGQRFAAQRRSA
jgi:hypothetical protein